MNNNERKPVITYVTDDGAPYYVAHHPTNKYISSHGDTEEEAEANFYEVLALIKRQNRPYNQTEAIAIAMASLRHCESAGALAAKDFERLSDCAPDDEAVDSLYEKILQANNLIHGVSRELGLHEKRIRLANS